MVQDVGLEETYPVGFQVWSKQGTEHPSSSINDWVDHGNSGFFVFLYLRERGEISTVLKLRIRCPGVCLTHSLLSYMGLWLFLLYHTALALLENKQNTALLSVLVFPKLIHICHSQDHSEGGRIISPSLPTGELKPSRRIAHWAELRLQPGSPTSFYKVPCICLFFWVTKGSVLLWIQFLSDMN